MKKNNSYLEDTIDLSEIIKTLWNEKILILSISLFFMVAGYVYGALQPNIYKTEITIREAPSSLFEAYRPFFSTQQQQQLTQNIINEINIHQHHLEIAKKIGLENTILQSIVEGRSVVNEPNALFYKGTKVLTQKITYLNKLLNETKNLTLDYNPILEQALSPALITKSPIIYAAITLLLGLFFSFLFIFFRNLLKE
jgi:capsular polysaccharide biosynthesis protein